ncbi:hypothetical protein SAMN05216296_2241 [Pseudomonas pohangensis]|jgi:hypothetical protein|uniref:Uncharacterized protein n=1 Tax=Pseudomonas pohangensis TaxID=364197 RepID=A0A1H2GES6_9PSED|nr:hypothetical protein [Pseudomonas pohangensis]SDU18014.1 hypothetical protein SAMN05216296_2241 [Pseudomonas pohangensis]
MLFAHVALAAAGATLILATGWLFFGRLLLRRWRIEPNVAALLLGRRIGAVYLGLSAIFFLASNAPASELRSALSLGTIIVCSLLAVLGLADFQARRAGPAILVSVLVEVLLVAGFSTIELSGAA